MRKQQFATGETTSAISATTISLAVFSATYPSGGRGGMAETATPPHRHYFSMAVSLYIVHLAGDTIADY